MRRGEVVGLRIENVYRQRGVVIVTEAIAESRGVVYRKSTKSEKIREVPLSGFAIEALTIQAEMRTADRESAGEAYIDHDLVFCDEIGRRLHPTAVTDALRRAAHRFGLRGCMLHTLRHTAATWLLAGGADIKTTSSILGHSDASTTLRIYSHVANERQRAAVGLSGDVLNASDGGKALAPPERIKGHWSLILFCQRKTCTAAAVTTQRTALQKKLGDSGALHLPSGSIYHHSAAYA